MINKRTGVFLFLLHLHGRVHVEEVVDKLLLRCGGAVLDLDVHGGPLVLVVGQAVLGPVVALVVVPVQSLDHVVGLGHSAAVSLHLPGALEEHHVAPEHLHDRVLVQGGLGERPGDVVAVFISVSHHLPPGWVLSGQGLGEVDLVPEVIGVALQVDLEVGVKHVHLDEDAGEGAHLGGHMILEFVEILEEFSKVLFGDLNETLSLSLAPEVVEEEVLQSVGIDGAGLGRIPRSLLYLPS